MKKSILIVLVSLAVSVFAGEREKYLSILQKGSQAIEALQEGPDRYQVMTTAQVGSVVERGEAVLAVLQARGQAFSPTPYSVASVDQSTGETTVKRVSGGASVAWVKK